MNYFEYSACVAVLAMLITKSVLFARPRDLCPDWVPCSCPICLGFWIAMPAMCDGPIFYLTIVGLSNLWMLAIAKLYLALADMDYTPE